MDGEGVAQVMQPRLKAPAVVPPDGGTITGKAEVVPKSVVIYLGALACREERPRRCRCTARVFSQSMPEVRSGAVAVASKNQREKRRWAGQE